MKLLKKIIVIIYAEKIVLTAKTSNLLKFIVHATHLFISLPRSHIYILNDSLNFYSQLHIQSGRNTKIHNYNYTYDLVSN